MTKFSFPTPLCCFLFPQSKNGSDLTSPIIVHVSIVCDVGTWRPEFVRGCIDPDVRMVCSVDGLKFSLVTVFGKEGKFDRRVFYSFGKGFSSENSLWRTKFGRFFVYVIRTK